MFKERDFEKFPKESSAFEILSFSIFLSISLRLHNIKVRNYVFSSLARKLVNSMISDKDVRSGWSNCAI